jgi:hypothetical protein
MIFGSAASSAGILRSFERGGAEVEDEDGIND